MKRPKSPPAASTRTKSPPRLSKPGACPAFTSSARCWMSPASSAASISNGLGLRDMRRDSTCNPHLRQNGVDVAACLRNVRHAAGLIDCGRTRVIRAQRLRYVSLIPIEKLLEKLRPGSDALFGIERIGHVEFVDRRGHQLH